MNLVNWTEILPPSASVSYSSLTIPDVERDALNRDIAEIRLSSGFVIDVEWREDDKQYVVNLFRDEYENFIVRLRCDSVSDVIEEVKTLAYEYESDRIESASSYKTYLHSYEHPQQYA